MNSPIISIIAAMDEKRGIGKQNRIPWHIKEDLINLKNLTKDQVNIVGYNTYLSMSGYYDKSGREMPGKVYIVVSDDPGFKPSRTNAIVVHSLEEAMEKAKHFKTKEVFVIGGAQIFKQMIRFADRLYLTEVKGDFDCDTFFPDYSAFGKEISSRSSSEQDLSYDFKVFEK